LGNDSIDQMSVGQMPGGQMSVGQMSVGQMPVGQMPVGQMSVGQMPVGQMSWPKSRGTIMRLRGRKALLIILYNYPLMLKNHFILTKVAK
jgi:hypothetical protein